MLLVTLVVIGHSWTMLPSGPLSDHTYSFLYAWHMPAFVMISGYLSRSMTWSRARITYAVRTLVVPYLAVECLLGLFRTYVGHEQLEDFVLHPHWPLWFLVALFLWRMTTPLVRMLPRPAAIGLAVTASVLIGWSTWEIFDVARVFGFLPFFVIGLAARPEQLELLRGRAVQVLAVVTMGGVWWATAHINTWARADWLYYNLPYAEFGDSGWTAIPTRLAVLGLGLVGGLAFLALVPRRGGWFTVMGAQSLVVYLFHGFFLKEARYLGYPAWLDGHPNLGWFTTSIAAGLLALALASPWVSRVLGWIADPFGRAKVGIDEAIGLAAVAQTPEDDVRRQLVGAGGVAARR
jgi:fucose 4-O-acetylase-like acetyltransferase